MSPYAQHLLLSTGRMDWTSRIEDERDTASWGRLTSEMKGILGRGGEFHDPYNNILISTSSFTPWEEQQQQSSLETGKVDAILFPAFKHIRSLTPSTAASTSTTTSETATSHLLREFTRAFLLPERLHRIYDGIPNAERRAKTRDPTVATNLPISVDDINTTTILICSHGQRDSRCGILGPLLHREFQAYIDSRCRSTTLEPADSTRYSAQVQKFLAAADGSPSSEPVPVNIGTMSHIGGHKWAGNVIVYTPPNAAALTAGARHPLAGKGIWYGRVEPCHVQGIVEETVLRGKVIRDLFRGGLDQDGSVIRL
ncbi:uncharacterized protein A1O9_01859 [Exophiala aquamarina CBS 119918]|uniref:Altered inheritance of mitochondria protein 32 n=1 Tax=Exophiala aquamarina CBS 119918 TaxID=1182545 RepID=A0A072PVI6_9EURO|nr:uncharacterized protein A1O9_01859 [Exophiala aquamarina CBS 119918]KEF63881.1 hypothetical protein A1O9_01859 [Exophiala aquamarina CBS 119918]